MFTGGASSGAFFPSTSSSDFLASTFLSDFSSFLSSFLAFLATTLSFLVLVSAFEAKRALLLYQDIEKDSIRSHYNARTKRYYDNTSIGTWSFNSHAQQ